MSENLEGLPVHGYRAQTPSAVNSVNVNKELEEHLLRRIEALHVAGADPRWVSIARTHIEQGFMALNRAVFRPARLVLPEDTK